MTPPHSPPQPPQSQSCVATAYPSVQASLHAFTPHAVSRQMQPFLAHLQGELSIPQSGLHACSQALESLPLCHVQTADRPLNGAQAPVQLAEGLQRGFVPLQQGSA